MSPGGFSDKELGRPPSPAKLDQAEREVRALEVWHESVGNIAAVMDEFGITKAQANILVNRASERYLEDKKTLANRLRTRQALILDEVLTKLHEAVRADDMNRVKDLLATTERQAKLHGLDEKREDEQVVPHFTVLNVLPETVLPPADIIVEQNELGAPEDP
jgi:hypothetical protein